MTQSQTLGEEVLLQTPVVPVLLRLPMDLHVGVTGLDFIEHSVERKDTFEKKSRKMETSCWFAPKANTHRES